MAGTVPPAKTADANRACRRVSIATRLLFHHDPRIGYSRLEYLVQHHIGLLHRREWADDHPMRLRAPVARADDVRAEAGDSRALDVGVCVSVEGAELNEQLAQIRASLHHRF